MFCITANCNVVGMPASLLSLLPLVSNSHSWHLPVSTLTHAFVHHPLQEDLVMPLN